MKSKRSPEKEAARKAKRAAQLKRAGKSAEEIAAQIADEFGSDDRVGLRDAPQPYAVYGNIGEDIETGALAQLELALRLPIAVRGALMPDAHPGYALPIGGVFAAHNAVAPAMVGVDIGCRMHLTLFAEPPEELLRRRTPLLADLQASTTFGAGGTRPRPADHEVLDDPRWELTNQTRSLQSKATAQLGTSGSGNHFAELVVGELVETGGQGDRETGRYGHSGVEANDSMSPNLPVSLSHYLPAPISIPRHFCGLLTHSGSRGVGYALANHYIRIATQETARTADVPRMYEWLDMDVEAGQEYWQAMELAGAFAQANHEVIHATFVRRSGLTPIGVVQNHHNFAWRQGELIVHRKGATPAAAGILGVIPGSMGTASYLVEGLGCKEALDSASHGAGRLGSRTTARNAISLNQARQFLKQHDILVEGLSVDEAPMAYKDIERVMNIQIAAGLIRPIARMHPVAVIMAGEPGQD